VSKTKIRFTDASTETAAQANRWPSPIVSETAWPAGDRGLDSFAIKG
jgi:hypothetical protein